MAHVKYANGETYIGEFKHNERDGKGLFTYANGDVYNGEFLHGQPHGTGMLVSGAQVTEG